ncbi:succinate dehydrogenase, partial [Aulographum hederae CBS 113979]
RVAVSRFAPPAAVATNSHIIQRRQVATTTDNTAEILAKQRLSRPVAPHLTIYQPQIPWLMSGLNRITGVALSGGLYIFGIAYLVSPLMGWHLESMSLAAAFGAWPVAAKVATKLTVALPFTYHCLNALRHLSWDFGMFFKNKQVVQTGWAVAGASVLSALALALFV